MSEDAKKPNEPRELTDQELEQISGGSGSWDHTYEESCRTYIGNAPDGGAGYVSRTFGPDFARAREAWLAAGSPRWVRYTYQDNRSITSEQFSGGGGGK